MDRGACVWLMSKDIKMEKLIQIKSHMCLGSAIYYVCVSPKVDVSMGKTWIIPTTNSTQNPPSTMRFDQIVSLCPCVETHFLGWGCVDCVPAFHLFSHESNTWWISSLRWFFCVHTCYKKRFVVVWWFLWVVCWFFVASHRTDRKYIENKFNMIKSLCPLTFSLCLGYDWLGTKRFG